MVGQYPKTTKNAIALTAPKKRDITGLFDKICSPVKTEVIGKTTVQETFDFDDDIF